MAQKAARQADSSGEQIETNSTTPVPGVVMEKEESKLCGREDSQQFLT